MTLYVFVPLFLKPDNFSSLGNIPQGRYAQIVFLPRRGEVCSPETISLYETSSRSDFIHPSGLHPLLMDFIERLRLASVGTGVPDGP